MQRKTIVVLSVGALLLSVAAFGKLGQAQLKSVNSMVVTGRDATSVLALTGRLDPIEDAVVSSTLASSRVSVIEVDLGVRVKRGQILIRLDDSELRAQLEQAQAGLSLDELSLSRARAAASGAMASSNIARATLASAIDLRTRRDEARDAVNAAKLKVAAAKAEYDKVANGGRPEEIRRAQASLKTAEATRDLRKKTLDRNQKLYDAGAIAKADLDEAELGYSTAQQEVLSAQEYLQTVRQPRSEDLTLMRAKLDEAESNLAASRTSLRNAEMSLSERLTLRSQATNSETEATTTQIAISVATSQVEKSRANVNQLRAQIEKANLRSPIDGVISRKGIFVGETAQPGAELMRVTTDSKFRATAEVDEKYVQQLQPGQAAIVQPESFPELRLPATIESISREANRDKGTVLVRFALAKHDPRLRADLTVDINITTANYKQAIVVPESAVQRKGNESICLVVRDGVAVEVPVTLGAATKGGTLVRSGLTSGDEVISDPKTIKPGDRVKTVKS